MTAHAPLRRALFTLVAVLLLAAPASAYIIVLKDGSTLTAAKEYEVQGDKAIITLPSGAQTQIALDQIDREKTRETNERGYGDAELIDDGTTKQVNQPKQEAPRRQNLSELANRESRFDRVEPRRRSQPEGSTASRTSAGFTDLSRIVRQPFHDIDVASEVQRFFRGQGIDSVEIYQGTQPSHLYVELTTASEASVFRALEVAAQALLASRESHPDGIQALELYLTTPDRERAGQFVLTRGMAEELNGGGTEVAQFFVENVQF